MPKSSKKAALSAWGMSPEQSRAARGWLGWSQDELAKQAHVALRTVASFERGEITPRYNNVVAMQRVIEAAGVRLVFGKDGTAAGILRENSDPDFSGSGGRNR